MVTGSMDGSCRRLHLGWVLIWPGLDRLWHQGSPWGLVAAVFQTLLLQLGLVSSFVWTGLLPVQARFVLWCFVCAGWLLGLIHNGRTASRRRTATQTDPQLDLFLAARAEYLRGEWTRAADLLDQILRTEPRDVESRLMLATLLRHAGRWEESREQLRRLQRLERAGHWNEEIQREWQSLAWQGLSVDQVPTADAPPALVDDAVRRAA